MSAATSVYLHVPWCLVRCPYCDFNTYAAQEWPEEEYTGALLSELEWFAARPPFAGSRLATVFFGGGTPSLFAPATIGRLVDGLAARFEVSADLEVTLEANPGTVDEKRLTGLRSAGVNRLSIGVQSFQPRLLDVLGRRHSVEQSRTAYALARRAGFENVSIDLMYASPGQTLDELESDLAQAIALEPEHVSAYALTWEPGTPFHRDLGAGRLERAPEELEAKMFEFVRFRLAAAGYPAYEISNHARPGREARHNQAYWRGGPYLGLGAGAHSFAPSASPLGENRTGFGVRWQNVRDPGRYRAAVASTGHAVDSAEPRTRSQALGEFCWLGLRETRGISPGEFAERFEASLEIAFPHLSDLRAEGVLEEREGRLALTARGLLVADAVFSSFF